MALSYRFAKETDLQRIFEIEQASMNCPWSLKSYQEAFSSENAIIIVAEVDDKLAGFSVFYLTPPEAELPDIVVDEAFRGQGIGRFILEKSIEDTEQGKKLSMNFCTKARLERMLNERMGFEQIGIRKYFYSNPVEDAVCMRLATDAD